MHVAKWHRGMNWLHTVAFQLVCQSQNDRDIETSLIAASLREERNTKRTTTTTKL